MQYHITNYRGIDIYFEDYDKERFTFAFDKIHWSERQTMASCKAKIDEYLRDNQNFKEFEVEEINGSGERIKIVGIRKDNRFVCLKDGKKEQLSEYDEKNWMEINPNNEQTVKDIIELNDEFDKLRKEMVEKIEHKKSQLIIKSLREIKKDLGV